jgi:hypothetical protein
MTRLGILKAQCVEQGAESIERDRAQHRALSKRARAQREGMITETPQAYAEATALGSRPGRGKSDQRRVIPY